MDEELDIVAIRKSVSDDYFELTPQEERQRDPWHQGTNFEPPFVSAQSAEVDSELEETELFA